MATIILEGWKEGLEKVSLTKLQIEILEKSLKESKENVDKLLDGEIVEITVDSINKAELFIQKANPIGVICRYES